MLFWIARIIAELIAAFALLLSAPQETPTPIVPTVSSTPTAVVTQTGDLDIWIAQSNWPQWTWETVKRIVWCESRGISGINTNPPHFGLMQVNVNFWGYPSGGPVSELNQGYQVYLIQGFNAWSCY